MEIRMAYPNEINRIMEIIQDGKDSLAAAGVDQWQDGYPDQEIIFEDILESRGYVAVENQEVVAYPLSTREMKLPIMTFMMENGNMITISISVSTESLLPKKPQVEA